MKEKFQSDLKKKWLRYEIIVSWKELRDCMDVEQIILDMIKNNKQNFESPLYNHDEYATGYYEGANDTLVSLLDNLGIKHNEDIINKM